MRRVLWKLFRSNKSISVLSKFNLKEQQVIVYDGKFGFEERLALNIKENPWAFFPYVRSTQKGKDAVVSLRVPHSELVLLLIAKVLLICLMIILCRSSPGRTFVVYPSFRLGMVSLIVFFRRSHS